MMENVIATEQAVSTFKADPVHSHVGFKVRHLGFSKVKGSFQDFDVTVQVDPEDLTTLQAEASVQTASITTGNVDRDNHLRSGDFFESETFPALTFRGNAVKNISGNSFHLEGDLTIRGTTKPVTLIGEFLGEAKDPWGNDRVAFEASTIINRKEFGLTWNQILETGGVLVGEDIEVILDIQAVKTAAEA